MIGSRRRRRRSPGRYGRPGSGVDPRLEATVPKSSDLLLTPVAGTMHTAPSTTIDEALVERMRDRIVTVATRSISTSSAPWHGGRRPPRATSTCSSSQTVPTARRRGSRRLPYDGSFEKRGFSSTSSCRRPSSFGISFFIARTARRDGRLFYTKAPPLPMPDPEYEDAAQEWCEQGDHDR